MKIRAFFIFLLISLSAFAEEKLVTIQGAEKGFESVAEYAGVFIDEDNTYSIGDVIDGQVEFSPINTPNPNFDFTTKGYWIRFTLKNVSHHKEFFIETARPLTNIADLYYTNARGEIQHLVNGDDRPFETRTIKHRKVIFPVELGEKEPTQFYLHLTSDGEVITAPIKVWIPEAFQTQNYKEQFIMGGYYGLLIFVIIIYFFFYAALKEKSFMWYVLYVISLFFFQFSIDGFSFQYLFPYSTWLGNHAILFSAGITVALVLKYAKEFLELRQTMPKYCRFFNGFIAATLVITALSLIDGPTYQFVFPIINGVSLIAIIFILIAIYGVMKRKHKVSPMFFTAFFLLITGSAIFILGNFSIIEPSFFTEQGIKLGSAFEVTFLSLTMANKFREIQQEKEKAQEELITQMDQINERLEVQVKERTAEIEEQKEVLAEKNEEILDSIHYSKRIQNAILPSRKIIDKYLPDSFVLYNPKDVVSGDFYWVAPVTTSNTEEKVVLFCAADCTGHGVPGAFMSLIGNNYLKLSLSQKDVNSPAEALDFLNKGVNSTLQQNDGETLKDGMDIALCALFPDSKKLYYAGAKNPLYIIKNGELTEIKGDKHPIGAYVDEELKPFTNHEINLDGGECIYVFSDGFPDQFGGPKGKKFMYGKFKKLLLEIHEKPMPEQRDILYQAFEDWRGDLEQIDDVCIIGVRV